MSNICAKCAGQGVIEVEGRMLECECALVRRIAASMPAYLRRAEVKPDHLSTGLFKMFKKNAFVVSSWPDMKAVVKAVIISNQNVFVKVTSDREIRDVYVGSKSRAAKGDEEGQIYNSLEDLMDPPGLVVVRLNELSYKNKAAPGALEEAICYRMDRDKPTWLFSDVDRAFSIGSHAYSESIADVIRSNFPTVNVPRIITHNQSDPFNSQPVSRIPDSMAEFVENTNSAQEPQEPQGIQEERPRPRPKARIKPSEDVDAQSGMESMYGGGLSKKGPPKGFGRGR